MARRSIKSKQRIAIENVIKSFKSDEGNFLVDRAIKVVTHSGGVMWFPIAFDVSDFEKLVDAIKAADSRISIVHYH